MGRLNIFVAISVGALLTACGAQGTDDNVPGDGRIGLAAGIEAMEDNLRSRAPGEPVKAVVVNDFSPENPLVSSVWFSTVPGEYGSVPQDGTTHLPAHIEMTFKQRSKPVYACYDVDNDLYLRFKSPSPDDKVYCVGLYPSAGWDDPSTGWNEGMPTSAYHDINGCEDLMFAREITGDWTDRFGDGLRFRHLLTWVTVVVVATGHEAIDQWGDITRLEIGSQPTVKVRLADGATEFSGADTDFVISDTPVPLHITSHEIGTALCSPKTEYKLKLTTERFGEQTLTIPINDPDGNPITDASGLIGKNIVITLYFGNVLIDGRCTLTDWIPENEELHHIYTPQTN